MEDEDSPQSEVPKHLLAATRNPDGINAEVLLLHHTPHGWATEPGGPTVLYRHRVAYLTPAIIRTLFGASVRLSTPGVVAALWETPNAEWQVLQQQHRLLQRFHLVELHDSRTEVGAHQLKLDNRLGLLIEKKAPS